MPGRFTVACLVAFGFTFFVNSIRADNWERFRGPNGQGIALDKNIPIKFSDSENVRWKIKLPGDGNGSPIVWGDRLFLQVSSNNASERSLLCIDTNTGKVIWTRSITGANVKLSRKDTSHASATPATDGEAVYIPFWDGKNIILHAYNFKGDKLWDRNLGEFVSQHGAGASPMIYKNLLIFSMDKDAHYDTNKKDKLVPNPATLYALDKKTGNTVWEKPREAIRACYAVPYLVEKPGNGPELLVTSTSAITSYEPETGKSIWSLGWKFPNGQLRTIAGSAYTNGLLVTTSGDGDGRRFMAGLELKGEGAMLRGEQLWSAAKNKESPYVPCVIIKGEHVYFVNDVGFAGCLHAKTGERIWYERLGDSNAIYASPVMIDGKVYAASDKGDVFVFAATPKFNLLATSNLGEYIRATPAVANGALYIRTKNHLFCIAGK